MIEQRQISRDSLFLLAELRIDGRDGEERIKVRNLSPGGMMGEGPVHVPRGSTVRVKIRNIGWVEGCVAWVRESRFGVAFRDAIDPHTARAPLRDGEHTPRYVRPPLSAVAQGPGARKL
ncbi:MAG: PilZ domain-containing protein [Novosphingobium sp.]